MTLKYWRVWIEGWWARVLHEWITVYDLELTVYNLGLKDLVEEFNDQYLLFEVKGLWFRAWDLVSKD